MQADSRKRVIVGGSINTDLVATAPRSPEEGETVTGTSFAIYGGGKGSNQAIAAARYGADVVIVGGLGRDAFGDARLADLRREGIDTSAVARLNDVASGVAMITVEDSGANRILYVPGATTAIDIDMVPDVMATRPVGVVLATIELPADVTVELFRMGRAAGARVILNATPEPEKAIELLPIVDVLVVNEPEAIALLGERGTTSDDGDRDWERVGRALLARGPAAVVLTLGGAGAMLVAGTAATLIPPPHATVVDTTGAGDALCGVFAAAIAEGRDDLDALARGVAAGSLACEVAGAQPSIPSREAIESRLTTA